MVSTCLSVAKLIGYAYFLIGVHLISTSSFYASGYRIIFRRHAFMIPRSSISPADIQSLPSARFGQSEFSTISGFPESFHPYPPQPGTESKPAILLHSSIPQCTSIPLRSISVAGYRPMKKDARRNLYVSKLTTDFTSHLFSHCSMLSTQTDCYTNLHRTLSSPAGSHGFPAR